MSYNKIVFFVLLIVARSLALAQFAPNDDVELLRDEPLLFSTTVLRQGKKGERFIVAAYRQDTHKVFLVGKDDKGKTIALNVPDTAVMLVKKDVITLNEQAFAALEGGRLAEAQKLMLQVAMLDRERSVCEEIATHITRITTAQLAYQQEAQKIPGIEAEIQRRLKNVAVQDRPNLLNANDRTNQVRANQMLMEANRIGENAKAVLKDKQEQIAAALKLFSALAVKRETADAYGEAVAIAGAVRAIASRSPDRWDGGISRESGISSIQSKASQAKALLDESRRALSVKKLNVALRAAEAGLALEAGSYGLRRTHGEISSRLGAVGKVYAAASLQQEQKHYEEALKILEQAREECTDHAESEALAIALGKTIAEKDQRIAKAKTAEAAQSFAVALEAYETYAMEGDVKRVLPLYAKQKETEGDFLSAYSIYEKCGSFAEMQRVLAMKDEQLAEYGKARVLLVEGKFIEALAIYRRFKNSAMEKDALRQQGVFLEGQGKFDDAMELYREAQFADEIARVKNFLSTRESNIQEGRQQEQAANYDKAIELFQKANSPLDVRRVAGAAAKMWEDKKDLALAAEYYEIAGMFGDAGRIRKDPSFASSVSLRKLTNPEIMKRCGPACVTIVSGAAGGGGGLGSGFFVAKGGYILTNNHVIKGATTIQVITASKDILNAKLITNTIFLN